MLTEPDSYGDYEGVCCAHIGRLIATQRPPHPHRTIAQHVGECFPSFACDRLGAVLDPVVVSLLPCRRRHEATARYAYDLPCSRCGAPLAARLSRSAASTRARSAALNSTGREVASGAAALTLGAVPPPIIIYKCNYS